MKRHRAVTRILWVLRALAVAAIPACGDAGLGSAFPAKPLPGQPAAARGDAAAKDAPSEADCLDYAQAVVKSAEAGDRAGFDALIDWQSIFNEASAGWNMSEKSRQNMFAGIQRSVSGENGLASQLIENSKQGGILSLLRARQRRGRRVVLFRMTYPIGQGGIAYYEFVPRRSADGRVRAADIYVYMAGENLTETFRRIMLPMVADQSRTIVDRLVAGEKDYVLDFPQLGRASQLVIQGKPAEALAICKALRPETRKHKAVLLIRLRAAQAVDEKEYAAVLEDFRKLYPGDPCLDLISIDAFLMKRDFSGAMKAVDRLDESLGGDPYLDLIRASIHETQGDLDAARRSARRAVEREPTLLPGYWAIVGYSLELKDYDEPLARLKEIDRTFQVTFADLSQVPMYAGFVKSAKYPEWLDYQKTRKPAPGQPPAR